MEALNSSERKFAEENHGLIYSFLNYYSLPEAEYYDLCAIAYLRAVKDWHSKPELREKYHADRIRDAYIAFSLNDLNAEGNEYLGQLPDPHDALREFESEQSAEAFLKDIMPALTERQRKHLAGMAGERKPREIMQEMRLSFTEFWKDRAAIREAAAAVIGRESCGGGYLILGQAGYY